VQAFLSKRRAKGKKNARRHQELVTLGVDSSDATSVACVLAEEEEDDDDDGENKFVDKGPTVTVSVKDGTIRVAVQFGKRHA
jgi:SOS response regulatory protein OraA/RecX